MSALREAVGATLLKAVELTPDELEEQDRKEFTQLTEALLAVFEAHQPTWTVPLVQDVTTAALNSLATSGWPVPRLDITVALAAAGIAPGEVR